MAEWDTAEIGDTMDPFYEGDPDASYLDICEEVYEGPFPYTCLRAKAHTGQHVATFTDGTVCLIWDKEV